MIEIILVIALFAILGAAATPVYTNFLARQYLENKTNEVISTLYTARTNSLAGKQDSPWGIHIDTQITLFQGEDYISRDPVFDQNYSIPASVSLAGLNELVFDQPNGNPNIAGTIIISNNLSESNTVTVNAIGTINLNE